MRRSSHHFETKLRESIGRLLLVLLLGKITLTFTQGLLVLRETMTLMVWMRRRTASTAASSSFICFSLSAQIFSPLLQGKGQGCHSNVPVFLPLARVSSLNLCRLALFVLASAISWSTNFLEAKSLLLILATDFMKSTSSQFPTLCYVWFTVPSLSMLNRLVP